MKQRTVFSTDVVESDNFLSMSLEAQLCYFHICSEAKPSGKIVGARRIVKSFGFSEDVLEELLECGYLLDADGSIFITNTWQNNSFEQRLFDAAMSKCEEYQEGKIAFAGQAGKSRYVLPNNRQSFGNF